MNWRDSIWAQTRSCGRRSQSVRMLRSVELPMKENTSLLRVKDAKLCTVAVFGIIFVVEIEQKQALWCLKRKSLN